MKYIYTYLILIGIIVGLSLYTCSRITQPPQYIVHTDTIPGDSVPVYITIEKPIPINHYYDTGSFKILYQKLDSTQILALLKEYYTKYIYIDTLKNDTSAFASVIDTVFKNQLQKRTFVFQNRRPTQINIFTPVSPSHNRFFLGITAGTKDITQFDLGPSALFVTKKKLAISYSYQILHKEHWITGYFKLF